MPFKVSLDALAEYTEDCASATGREQQHATTVALHDNFCDFQLVRGVSSHVSATGRATCGVQYLTGFYGFVV